MRSTCAPSCIVPAIIGLVKGQQSIIPFVPQLVWDNKSGMTVEHMAGGNQLSPTSRTPSLPFVVRGNLDFTNYVIRHLRVLTAAGTRSTCGHCHGVVQPQRSGRATETNRAQRPNKALASSARRRSRRRSTYSVPKAKEARRDPPCARNTLSE